MDDKKFLMILNFSVAFFPIRNLPSQRKANILTNQCDRWKGHYLMRNLKLDSVVD